MEACGGAHYWGRELAKLGHEVRLMSPRFVRPYVKSNKNDARDAEAICEAVARPSMRFVTVKSQLQEDARVAPSTFAANPGAYGVDEPDARVAG
jgi:transposase